MIHFNDKNYKLEHLVGSYNQTLRSSLRKDATTDVPEKWSEEAWTSNLLIEKGNNAQWPKGMQVWKGT